MPPDVRYVLFDLDQTIVPWDTQLVFRSYVLQAEPWRRILTLVFLIFLPFAKVIGTGGMKRVFHSYLWRMSENRLQELVENFLKEWLPKLPYPEILEEIAHYKQAGYRLILSSASPEIWVEGIGRRLGFDHSHGTHFDWGKKTDLFPDLVGKNHKGDAKVVRLAGHGVVAAEAGFSDSAADLPMLKLCKKVTLVNPLPKVRAHGEANGWTILEPDRPWKNRFHFGLGCARQLFGFWKP